jgi:phosphoribosylamine--glycine ligase
VLCVTSFGENVAEAAFRSKSVLQQIKFDGMYYRSDIGWEFM